MGEEGHVNKRHAPWENFYNDLAGPILLALDKQSLDLQVPKGGTTYALAKTQVDIIT